MKFTRYLGLIVWPILASAYLLAIAAAAGLPWLPVDPTLPLTWTAVALAGAAAILLWVLVFWVLRRRYVWLTLHPEAESMGLRLGQWLEVGLGGLACGTVAGLLAYAGANYALNGLYLNDLRMGPIVAVGGATAWLMGWVIRNSCRRANRVRLRASIDSTAEAAPAGEPAPAAPAGEPAPPVVAGAVPAALAPPESAPLSSLSVAGPDDGPNAESPDPKANSADEAPGDSHRREPDRSDSSVPHA